MADATLQILGLGTGAVPLDYNVTGDQSLDLVAVTADFDGTGAGASWLPAVQIISAAGRVMAQSVGSTVAAGGSASPTFAPFLEPVAVASTGGVTWHGARYTGGVTTIAQNATGTFAFTLSFGDALLDLSVPAAPKFVTGGIYIVSQIARCVIALGGSQVAGTSFSGNILISSSTGGIGQNVSQRFTWPSGGSFVPQVLVNSVPINVNAGDGLTAGATNSDSAAGNHVYDSPSIWVVKLS